jgi:hypothetical protein
VFQKGLYNFENLYTINETRYRAGFGVVLKENTSSLFTLKMFYTYVASIGYSADIPLVPCRFLSRLALAFQVLLAQQQRKFLL